MFAYDSFEIRKYFLVLTMHQYIFHRYGGGSYEAWVLSPMERNLMKHMLPPVFKDFSQCLLSPMPGTLVTLDGKWEYEPASLNY